MAEGDVRRIHATVGVILSILLLVQIGSGTMIAFYEFLGYGRHVHAVHSAATHDAADPNRDAGLSDNTVQIIHHHGGRLVQAFRTILGLGALFMVLSGLRIYGLVRKRKK
jgi:hypothetical protein